MDRSKNVRDNARVSGNARVYGEALVCDNAYVSGEAQVSGQALVSGEALVSGQALVFGNAQVSGNAWVSDNARVHGTAQVLGGARVGPSADVFRPQHTIVLTGVFPESVTLYRTTDGGHRVQAGCQNFSLHDNLELIAYRHDWTLPVGWEAVRTALLALAANWADDVPPKP